jgi:hypothetical protein
MRLLLSAGSCACSLLLAAVSTLSLLGALSCATHGLVMATSATAGAQPEEAAALTHLSSASALAGVAMACVFVGGVHVALRLCSLGLGMLLLAVHLWLRTSDPASLSRAADALLVSVMLPLRAAVSPGQEWDCVFFGPSDALYMMAATRHAASVLAGMRRLVAGVPVLALLT